MFSDLKEKQFCSAEALKDKWMHMQDEEDPALIQEFLKQTTKKKSSQSESTMSPTRSFVWMVLIGFPVRPHGQRLSYDSSG